MPSRPMRAIAASMLVGLLPTLAGAPTAVASTPTSETWPPVVSQQPADARVGYGQRAVFTAAYSPAGVAAQWQRSTDDGASWSDVGGVDLSVPDVVGTATVDGSTGEVPIYDPALARTGVMVITAPSGTRIAEVRHNMGIAVNFVLAGDGRTAIASRSTTWGGPGGTVWLTLTVDQDQEPGSFLGDGSAEITSSAGTLIGTARIGVSVDGGEPWEDAGTLARTSHVVDAATDDLDGALYRVALRSPDDPGTAGYSDAARLTLEPELPAILQNPEDRVVAEGDPVELTAQYSWAPAVRAQWQRSTDDGTTWTDVNGVVLTKPDVVGSALAGESTGELAIYDGDRSRTGVKVITAPSGTRIVAARTNAVTPATFDISPDGRTATSSRSVTWGGASITSWVTLQVDDGVPPETFLGDGLVEIVDAGGAVIGTARLGVSVEGGQPWPDTAEIIETRHTIQAAGPELDGALYRVVLTNVFGQVESRWATLTVTTDPPQVVEHPQGATVVAPGGVTFSASATGTPTVQWQQSPDGLTWADVAGATRETYTLASVSHVADGTSFRAVFTNRAGQAVTDPATLTVLRVEPFTLTITGTVVPADAAHDRTASSSSAGRG